MKKTIKNIISILFAAVLTVSAAAALEWGGLFSMKLNPVINATAPITAENLSLQETNDVYFWLNTALDKKKTVFLNAEMQYELGWFNQGGNSVLTNIIDFDLLKISGAFTLPNSAPVEYAIGRYPITDSTGVIFSQVSDGVFATVTMPTFVVSGYIGFTGLLNALNVSMLDGTGNPEAATKSVYELAHPYLPTNISVEFPVLFGNQSLSVQANAFFDFKDDAYNRYYANFVMSGPISNTTYYKLSSSFGSVNFADVMNYTSFSLFMFPMSNLSLTLGGEYASGAQLGLNKFTGFSSRVAYGSPLSPQTTGVLIPNASLAWALNNSIYTGFTGKVIMSIPGTSIEKTAAELATDLIYNLFSDLQIGLNIDWYVPVGETDDSQKFSATLNVGVSF